MGLDDQRKAYPYARVHDWSPADGAFVRICPVDAITVSPMPVLEKGRPDRLGSGANAANAVDAASPANASSSHPLIENEPALVETPVPATADE